MRKKVLCMILASIFCLCGLGMLSGCGEDLTLTGTFYTVEEAYEQGLLSKENLQELSYNLSEKIIIEATEEERLPIRDDLRKEFILNMGEEYEPWLESCGFETVELESFDIMKGFRGKFNECFIFFYIHFLTFCEYF